MSKFQTLEQVGKEFKESDIGELAASLAVLGLQQAITVFYEEEEKRFILVHGERRLRVALHLGWKEITFDR